MKIFLYFTIIYTLLSSMILTEEIDHVVGRSDSGQTNQLLDTFDCEVAASISDIPSDECLALVNFYYSTNGAGWKTNSGWLLDENIANWYGLILTDGHVTSIVLDHNSLTGPIPDSISQLPYLDEICLLSNAVTGPLPDSLGDVYLLTKLSLSDNLISGEIPSSFEKLSNLEKLSLGQNLLTGTLPEKLGNLPLLDRIDLHNNQLSGEIPESWGQLTNLTELVLYKNNFTGLVPASFVNLEKLDFFYFFATDLCERYDPAFLAWKATVSEWWGTGCVCRIYFPIVFR